MSSNEYIKNYNKLIIKIAWKIIKNHAVSFSVIEDLISEGNLSIIEAINKDNDKYKELNSTYIHKIVHGRMIDYLRDFSKSRNSYRTYPMSNEKIEICYKNNENSIENELIIKENLDNMYKAIDSLPKQYRSIMLLKYKYDIEIEDIAMLYKCTNSYISAITTRAIATIKEILRNKSFYDR